MSDPDQDPKKTSVRARLAAKATARREAPQGREPWTAEVMVSLVIGMVALYISTTGLAHEVKLPVELMLVFFEVSFVLYRLYDRRLAAAMWKIEQSTEALSKRLEDKLASAVPQIDSDHLTDLTTNWLTQKRAGVITFADRLSHLHNVELEKEETYREVIELTNVVAEQRLGEIVAISSLNIEDFEEEPLAEAYLEANRRAVEQGVPIRRLFLLSEQQRTDSYVREMIHKHATALKQTGSGSEAVRWMTKSAAGPRDQHEDFALFAEQAVVRQMVNGRFELNEVPETVRDLKRLFLRLWDHQHVKFVDQLVPSTPRGSQARRRQRPGRR